MENKSLAQLHARGSQATAAQLIRCLKLVAEAGHPITATAAQNVFRAIAPLSVEDIEVLVTIAREGARLQYRRYRYANMAQYDLLTHYLEEQLDATVTATAGARRSAETNP